jgi:hypothetical protein
MFAFIHIAKGSPATMSLVAGAKAVGSHVISKPGGFLQVVC